MISLLFFIALFRSSFSPLPLKCFSSLFSIRASLNCQVTIFKTKNNFSFYEIWKSVQVGAFSSASWGAVSIEPEYNINLHSYHFASAGLFEFVILIKWRQLASAPFFLSWFSFSLDTVNTEFLLWFQVCLDFTMHRGSLKLTIKR